MFNSDVSCIIVVDVIIGDNSKYEFDFTIVACFTIQFNFITVNFCFAL